MKAGHTHYTPSGGIPELKNAVCDLYQRDYGLNLSEIARIWTGGSPLRWISSP